MKGLCVSALTLLALPVAAQQSTPTFRVAEAYRPGQAIVLITDQLKEGVARPPDRETRPGEPGSIHSASLDQFPEQFRPKLGSRYYIYPANDGVKVATIEAPVVVEGCSDAWLGVRARFAGSTSEPSAANPDDLRSVYTLASSTPMRRSQAGITPVN